MPLRENLSTYFVYFSHVCRGPRFNKQLLDIERFDNSPQYDILLENPRSNEKQNGCAMVNLTSAKNVLDDPVRDILFDLLGDLSRYLNPILQPDNLRMLKVGYRADPKPVEW